MTLRPTNPAPRRSGRYFAALLATSAVLVPASAYAQLLYHSPEAAAAALYAAAKADDTKAMLAILGPSGSDIVASGDPVSDDANRGAFVAAYDAKHELTVEGPFKSILVIGDKDWPLPIPITKRKGMWRFNTPSGRQEILYRRVGENETDAIQVALAYVDAQKEYAAEDPEGTGSHPYAQHVVSAAGKKDGLYWPSQAGQPESPVGPFMADATKEGYTPGGGAPYHGYYYRILTGQGPAAVGGAQDYIVDGKMIGGFALVAWPATYGVSGVMTFAVNYDGVVFEKDLGLGTAGIASSMKLFDPGQGWKPSQPDESGTNQ